MELVPPMTVSPRVLTPPSNKRRESLEEYLKAQDGGAVGISTSMTELMRAATWEDVGPLVDLLNSEEALSSLFVKDSKGRTALDWARLCNNDLAVAALRKAMLSSIDTARVEMVSATVDLNEKTSFANQKATRDIFAALEQRDATAACAVVTSSKELERESVDRIGEVYYLDAQDRLGFTPLMHAAANNMIDLVALCLDNDCELEQQNRYGHTAFTWACCGGHAEVAKTLLFHGANIHHKTAEGRCGMHYACLYLKARVVSVLLDFLFERFSTYRVSSLHPKSTFDGSRWTRYATMLEGFINIRDNEGKRAYDLLPPLPFSLTAGGGGLVAASILATNDEAVGDGDVGRYRQAASKARKEIEDATPAEKIAHEVEEEEAHEEEGGEEEEEKEGHEDNRDKQMENAEGEARDGGREEEGGGGGVVNASENEDVVPEKLLSPPSSAFGGSRDEQRASLASAGSISRPSGPIKTRAAPPALTPAQAYENFQLVKYGLGSEDREKFDGGGRGGEKGEEDDDWASVAQEESTLVSSVVEAGGEDENGSVFSLSSLPQWDNGDPDSLHAQGLHKLGDAHHVGASLPYDQEVFIIGKLFRDARERIAVWRMSCQAEEDLLKLVPCLLGCGSQETVEGLSTHIRDMCPFRAKQCQLCRQIYRFCELQDHIEHECPKRLVGCPNAYEGCCEMVTFDFLYQHENLRCKYRRVPCRLNCNGMIPYCKRDDHEETHCNKRLLSCDQCHKLVPAALFGVHLKTECDERKLRCRVSCQGLFAAKNLEHHEQEQCIQPCRWQCGQRIGPKERRNLHELMSCLKRPTKCANLCGLGGLTAEFLEEHERFQCPCTHLDCPNSCGEKLLRRDLAEHLDPWHGSCPERRVRCPSNLVGWQVLVFNHSRSPTEEQQLQQQNFEMEEEDDDVDEGNDEVEGVQEAADGSAVVVKKSKKAKKKPSLPVKSPAALLNTFDEEGQLGLVVRYLRTPNAAGSMHVREPDGEDKLYVRFSDRHEWLSYWSKEIRMIPIRKPGGVNTHAKTHKDTHYDCGWIVFADLNVHLAFECTRRPVWVAGATDTPGFKGQQTTFNSSLALAVSRNELDEFIQAPPSTVTCEFCANDFLPGNMSQHQKLDCPKIIVRCRLGCGLKMARCLLEGHAESECPKRPLSCMDCGEQGLWQDELDTHANSLCPNRFVLCKLDCGRTDLLACTEEHHRVNECPLRIIKCTCNQHMRACDHEDHLISDCSNKLTLCPQGCGVIRARDQMDYHIEHECIKKGTFYSRKIFCPVGCGLRLMRRDVIEHVCYHCKRRLSDCPFNCGQSVQFEKLRLHLYFCPRRPICCEPGMKQCNQLFFKWFYCIPAAVDAGRGRMGGGKKNSVELLKGGDSFYEDDDDLDDDNDGARGGKGGVHYEIDGGESSVSVLGDFEEAGGGGGELVKFSRGGEAALSSRQGTSHSKRGSTPLPQTSSIYYVEGNMFLHPNLRMKGCRQHNATALMAAVRASELPLADFIVKATNGVDLDLETSSGETALTMACRYGKLEFVELLIQAGADINWETSTGKTALIEAVRAPIENLAIIELLVQSGALVKYKTLKHGRTAMEWARLMVKAATVRILDLGATVQSQTDVLFAAIGNGDMDKLRALVGDGDFFDANNERNLAIAMENEVAITRKAHEDVVDLKKTMKSLTITVEKARVELAVEDEKLEKAKARVEKEYKQQENLFYGISQLFVAYEKIAFTLLRSDLEEISRQRRPDLVVRIAVFAYGIMLGLLDKEQYPTNTCDFESAKQWWPICAKALADSGEAIKRIRAYSIGRLMVAVAKPTLDRARSLYTDLSSAILADRMMKTSTQNHIRLNSRGARRKPRGKQQQEIGSGNEEQELLDKERKKREAQELADKASAVDPSAPVVIIPWGTKKSKEVGSIIGMVASTALAIATNTHNEADRERNDDDDDDDSPNKPIPDVDWDSEADEAGGGEWVKGEWVPIIKKKERWWERKKKKQKKAYELVDGRYVKVEGEGRAPLSPADAEKMKKQKEEEEAERMAMEERKELMKRQGREEVEIVEFETKDLAGALKITNVGIQDEAYSATLTDNSVSHFVRTVLVMLKACDKLAQDQVAIEKNKRKIESTSVWFREEELRHQAAHVAFIGAQSKRLTTEKILTDMMKFARFTLRKARLYREKLRVARLLNMVTLSGHTAVSFAASLGNTEAVDELLSRGATVGFNSLLLHLSASYIQLSYRIYRFVTEASREKSKKPKAGGKEVVATSSEEKEEDDGNDSVSKGGGASTVVGNEPEAPTDVGIMGGGDFVAVTSNAAIEKMFAMKEHRGRILGKIRYQRGRMRFPVPEAAYMGKWETILRIKTRRLLHHNFTYTWAFPSPPPPFIRHHRHFVAAPPKIDVLTILAHGMSDMAAGQYVEYQGWVGANDPREQYGESQEELSLIVMQHKKQREEFHAERFRLRCLSKARHKAAKMEPEMVSAIREQNFRTCMMLAINYAVSIDMETPQGVTALVAAAEEDTGRVNYAAMLNDDMKPVLAVEYLLDRIDYRPSINLEVSCGHTALIRAASLSRATVVQALCDRGAEINVKNSHGKVPLHYAAEVGSYDCCRILMERGADTQILTPDGLSAYDIADSYGFLHCMKSISRFAAGFLGPVRSKRGMVIETIRCPLGCGIEIFPHEEHDHCAICVMRIVPCPLDCGERLIMVKELDEHMEKECCRRPYQCPKCSETIEFRDWDKHWANNCSRRQVICTLGCGRLVKAFEMLKHHKFCVWRMLECSFQCGTFVKECEMLEHKKHECQNRRVSCPLKCAGLIVHRLLNNHLMDVCPNRVSVCNFCFAKMERKVLEAHRKVCHLRLVECPNKCDESGDISLPDLPKHLAETCANRFVPCPLKCGQNIRLSDTDTHLQKICENRMVPCPLKCVVSEDVPMLERVVVEFRAKILQLHIDLDCPERLVQCWMCREGTVAKQYKLHQASLCPMRPVACRMPGCAKELPLGVREEHERKTCKFRLIVCPQGCGQQVAHITCSKHMMFTCPWRRVACALGCGEMMRHKELRRHVAEECVRRFEQKDAKYGGGEAGGGTKAHAPAPHAHRAEKVPIGQKKTAAVAAVSSHEHEAAAEGHGEKMA